MLNEKDLAASAPTPIGGRFDQAMKPLGITRSQWWVLSQLLRHARSGLLQAENDLARLAVNLGAALSTQTLRKRRRALALEDMKVV